MFKIISVTNRKLCSGDFLEQIEKIASSKISSIILREKDMVEGEYELLAKQVIDVCKKYNTQCILHNYIDVAKRLKWDKIHLSLPLLEKNYNRLDPFKVIGASIHSVEEARIARSLGATYVTAGHVFETDCKKDLKPRGLEFLSKVCKEVDIPVYGIGGISLNNIDEVYNAGAEGVCIMSSFMKSSSVGEDINKLQHRVLV